MTMPVLKQPLQLLAVLSPVTMQGALKQAEA